MGFSLNIPSFINEPFEETIDAVKRSVNNISTNNTIDVAQNANKIAREQNISLEKAIKIAQNANKIATEQNISLEKATKIALNANKIATEQNITLEKATEIAINVNKIATEQNISLEKAIKIAQNATKIAREQNISLEKAIKIAQNANKIAREQNISLEKAIKIAQNANKIAREQNITLEKAIEIAINANKIATERNISVEGATEIAIDAQTIATEQNISVEEATVIVLETNDDNNETPAPERINNIINDTLQEILDESLDGSITRDDTNRIINEGTSGLSQEVINIITPIIMDKIPQELIEIINGKSKIPPIEIEKEIEKEKEKKEKEKEKIEKKKEKIEKSGEDLEKIMEDEQQKITKSIISNHDTKSIILFMAGFAVFVGVLVFPKTQINYLTYTKNDILIITFYMIITFTLSYAIIDYITSKYSFVKLDEYNKLQIINDYEQLNTISHMFSYILPIIFLISLFYHIHKNEYRTFSNNYKLGVYGLSFIIYIIIIVCYQIMGNINVVNISEKTEEKN